MEINTREFKKSIELTNSAVAKKLPTLFLKVLN